MSEPVEMWRKVVITIALVVGTVAVGGAVIDLQDEPLRIQQVFVLGWGVGSFFAVALIVAPLVFRGRAPRPGAGAGATREIVNVE